MNWEKGDPLVNGSVRHIAHSRVGSCGGGGVGRSLVFFLPPVTASAAPLPRPSKPSRRGNEHDDVRGDV